MIIYKFLIKAKISLKFISIIKPDCLKRFFIGIEKYYFYLISTYLVLIS